MADISGDQPGNQMQMDHVFRTSNGLESLKMRISWVIYLSYYKSGGHAVA
jgi:hypothetical protein